MNHRTTKFLLLAGTLCLASFTLLASLPSTSVSFNANDIYSQKCAKCHGADGAGVEKYKKKGIKSFADAAWQKANSDSKITAAINNGKGEAMPAWKTKLSGDDIKGLVGVIRGFKK